MLRVVVGERLEDDVLVALVDGGEPVGVGDDAALDPAAARERVEVVAGRHAPVQRAQDGGRGQHAVLGQAYLRLERYTAFYILNYPP